VAGDDALLFTPKMCFKFPLCVVFFENRKKSEKHPKIHKNVVKVIKLLGQTFKLLNRESEEE
jgi:hypothetical protein